MKKIGRLLILALMAGCGSESSTDAGIVSDGETENQNTPPTQNTPPLIDTTKPTVTASPPGGGSFDDPVLVTLTASEKATIHFRLDGIARSTSPVYTEPILITKTTFLSVMAVDSAGNKSDPVIKSYLIKSALGLPNIKLKGIINVKHDSLGFVHYLGELINVGDKPACFIKIAIVSRDASGIIIDSDLTFVDGSPMRVFSITTDTCLNPGEFGAFHMFTLLKSSPSSFTHTISWDWEKINPMLVPSSDMVVSGPLNDQIQSFTGYLTLTGVIKNNHPSKTVSFVRISFAALNGDNVVDTDFIFVNGSTCGTFTTTTCLAPGEAGTFSIRFSVPPSGVTSYYYKISYNVE